MGIAVAGSMSCAFKNDHLHSVLVLQDCKLTAFGRLGHIAVCSIMQFCYLTNTTKLRRGFLGLGMTTTAPMKLLMAVIFAYGYKQALCAVRGQEEADCASIPHFEAKVRCSHETPTSSCSLVTAANGLLQGACAPASIQNNV